MCRLWLCACRFRGAPVGTLSTSLSPSPHSLAISMRSNSPQVRPLGRRGGGAGCSVGMLLVFSVVFSVVSCRCALGVAEPDVRCRQGPNRAEVKVTKEMARGWATQAAEGNLFPAKPRTAVAVSACRFVSFSLSLSLSLSLSQFFHLPMCGARVALVHSVHLRKRVCVCVCVCARARARALCCLTFVCAYVYLLESELTRYFPFDCSHCSVFSYCRMSYYTRHIILPTHLVTSS